MLISDLRSKIEDDLLVENEEIHPNVDIPDTVEEKVSSLYENYLKDKSKLVLTRYMKIFDVGHSQVLGIAHAKINNDFNKGYDKLKFPIQKQRKKY